MQIQVLAKLLNAQIDPDTELEITGVATIEDAGPGEITFLANPKYTAKLADCRAGAVLITEHFSGKCKPLGVRVSDPYLAFAKAIEVFHRKPQPARNVHTTAVLGKGVQLGANVAIGAYSVIGNHVEIGDNVTIYPHCTVYDGAVIGRDCILHSQVVVREDVQLGEGVILQNGAVIGADGFGFVPLKDGSFYKILQAGTVMLGDGVEVQANTTIDRSTIGLTEVGQGTKIDNLVQVGHGCKIGQHTLLCGQVGLAGSTLIGNHVILAGQVGVAGHLEIGDGSTIASQSGVNTSLPPKSQVWGTPAIEHRLALRVGAAQKHLPNMLQRLKQLEQRLAKLDGQPSGKTG